MSVRLGSGLPPPPAWPAQISCGSCQVCAEPESIPGIDIIIQAVALTDTLATVWVKSDTQFFSLVAQAVCTSKKQGGGGGEMRRVLMTIKPQGRHGHDFAQDAKVDVIALCFKGLVIGTSKLTSLCFYRFIRHLRRCFPRVAVVVVVVKRMICECESGPGRSRVCATDDDDD